MSDAKSAGPTISAPAPAASVIEAPQSVILGPVMRKKELIDKVVTRSGMKKKDVKPVVDAVLAELGDALADNRELNLHPLGKLKVRREKKLPNGRMVVAKIRQPNSGPASE
ncbi:MAG: HU family DNA-binding protein [Sulfitobacter sp.]|nr:HU family DNA-binding protein [Sulfitobacter sp.]